METIQATVNQRLLTKASRLFTGSLQGRIIEILQNARRASATKVEIVNEDGLVVVRDNGTGIGDFTRLLDLGDSGWEDALEASEDPAGVGIFCLAPREVTLRSNGRIITISGDGWTGAPVKIHEDADPMKGTALRFEDEPWDRSAVELNAVFCGMSVIVDGQDCVRLPFVSEQAAHHPQLGCRIEVCECQDLNPWHHSCKRERWHWANVIVNFHGQAVAFDYHPVSEHGLHYLVDMTDEPTGIRLMLPARTRLIENEAFVVLKTAMEREAYHYLQQRGHHRLPYKEYLRASELNIYLPEAKPTFTAGLLTGESPEPIEVEMPKDFPLAKCYCLDPGFPGEGTDEANVHLLAALGEFKERFVPVDIKQCYDGYSWAALKTITTVEVTVGKTLHEFWLWSGNIICVDSLEIHVHTSDGRAWSSPVCMAIQPAPEDRERSWCEEQVLVTPEARDHLNPSDIWFHLGGWCDEGDTYDTQFEQFEEDLDRFWAQLIGPDENLRQRILAALDNLTDWKEVTISPDGKVVIHFNNGSERTIEPPIS